MSTTSPADGFSLGQEREILFAWTGRLLRARYRQSALGILWAILQPAAHVAILTVVFTLIVPIETGGVPYVLFSYAAMVPWMLFSASLGDMIPSVVDNMMLIGKVYFPRQILPLAALLARCLDFAIAFIVLLPLLAGFGIAVQPSLLLYLPLLFAIEIAAIVGVGLTGAALNVFYRDVRHLFVLGVQLWLYATPVIYPVTLVPEGLRVACFLNPMTGVVEGFRAVLLFGQPPNAWVWMSAASALALLLAGVRFFRRVEGRFADLI